MEFNEILSTRRSVRKFIDKEIPSEVVERLVEATLSAPSSRNSHSTHLVVVSDKDVIASIADMRDYGSAFVKNAPMFIVVMGDTSASDLWEVNCSISATILQLACTSEGLSSCWVHVGGRPQKQAEPDGAQAIDHLRTLIDIPQGFEVLCGIALGYSEFTPAPLPEFDKASKVSYR